MPTPSTGSGFKVRNYDGNDNDLELVTDSDGTFRIGAGIQTTIDSKTNQYAVYRDGSYYISNGGLISTATPTEYTFREGIAVEKSPVLELYSYNGNYYYKTGTSTWHEGIDRVLIGTYWTYSGTEVTDTDLIDELDANASEETITDVVYKEATFEKETSTDTNQPIATREEATELNNNDILVWDATANQLKHITRPTINGTALKAIVANGVVTGYDWGSSGGNGVAFIGTRTAYNTAKLIPEGQDGYIPAGAMVVITDEDELVIGDEQ